MHIDAEISYDKTMKPVSTDTQAQARTQLIELLFRNTPLSYSLTLINSVLVFLVLEEYVPRLELILWLVAVIVVTLFRLFIVRGFWNKKPGQQHAEFYLKMLLVGTHLSALIWGVLILVPGEYTLDWIESFIAFVLAGMSAGVLLSLSPLISAAIPYLLLILMPLTIYFYQQSDFPHFAMGLMATLYLVLLVRLVFRNHQLLADTIRQDIENRNLFTFLDRAHQETGLLRVQLDQQLENMPGLLREKSRYFDLVGTPALITDMAGNIRLVNPTLLQLLGKEAGMVLGSAITEYAEQEDGRIIREILDKIGSGQTGISSQFSLRTSTGNHPVYRWDINHDQQVIFWSGSHI